MSDGTNFGTVNIPMSLLLGDSNGDHSVNAGDTVQTRSRSGFSADATTFRSDMNADGVINAGDVTIVRAHSGGAVNAEPAQ